MIFMATVTKAIIMAMTIIPGALKIVDIRGSVLPEASNFSPRLAFLLLTILKRNKRKMTVS